MVFILFGCGNIETEDAISESAGNEALIGVKTINNSKKYSNSDEYSSANEAKNTPEINESSNSELFTSTQEKQLVNKDELLKVEESEIETADTGKTTEISENNNHICTIYDEDGFCIKCGLPSPDVPEETYCTHENVYKNIADNGKIDFICHNCGMDGLYEFYDGYDKDYEIQVGMITEEESEHFCEEFEDGFCVDCGMENPWVYYNENAESVCEHTNVKRVVSADGKIDFICDDCGMDGLYSEYDGVDEEYERQAGIFVDDTDDSQESIDEDECLDIDNLK